MSKESCLWHKMVKMGQRWIKGQIYEYFVLFLVKVCKHVFSGYVYGEVCIFAQKHEIQRFSRNMPF